MRPTDLKGLPGSSSSKNVHILSLGVIIFVVVGIYILHLFSMQIVEGAKYRKQSEIISQRSKRIPAQRGEIYDRNVTLPMVINTDSFAVDIIPGEIPADRYDTVTAKLANLLGITKKDIDKKVPPSARKSFTTIEVKSNVSFSVISEIAENIVELPGISWRSKPIRNYVETGSISHVVGYVGDITKEELKVRYNRGYTTNSVIGKAGIESQYDELLQGVEGSELRTVDVRGRYMTEPPVIRTPVMGKNLVLTIDRDIQILVEKALGKRIGAAVVLKPATGEVLAMVSYPYYDPNIFSRENMSSEYNRLINDPNNPLLNRVVNASYPPASTFKIVMTTALLAENSISPEKTIECLGEITYGDRLFRCHIRKPGHGFVDMQNGFAQSCDVYFWVTGRDYLGIDRIASYAKEFGFGESTNIDLPSQTSGFVPTPQWKERRFHEKWLGGDTINLSIGQGYMLVSPLQIANMVAMVVNDGVIYQPHLLKEVRDPTSNDVINEVKPEVLFKSNISESVWKQVRDDMRYTVSDGSAWFPLRNKKVQIAGKTGTGEVAGYTNQWHSWFAAYAPFDGPPEDAVVVAVLVEAVNQWEWWAPYCSNIIFQGIFADQTYDEAVDALGFRYLMKPVGRQE